MQKINIYEKIFKWKLNQKSFFIFPEVWSNIHAVPKDETIYIYLHSKADYLFIHTCASVFGLALAELLV